MKFTTKTSSLFAICALIGASAFAQTKNPNTILNVSYDVSRELYKDINPVFAAEWKAKTGTAPTSINPMAGPANKLAQLLAVLRPMLSP
ncbi:hypothetical protein [Polynucleobacter necessarius]|uniref:hypothetical protein n=1 Tax=Polynucleobacter necessarius TaxID=576610 RepID=UPI001E3691CD|nr:hypothetical protein [Polynucleobacter necessarius]